MVFGAPSNEILPKQINKIDYTIIKLCTKMNNQVDNMVEDQDDMKPVSIDLTKSVLVEQDAGVHLTYVSNDLIFIPEIYSDSEKQLKIL